MATCVKKQTKSLNVLRIPEEDRRKTLMSNPNVSADDLHSVLISTQEIRLERKESFNELRKQMLAKKKKKLHMDKTRQRARIKEESKDRLIEVKIVQLKTETSGFNPRHERKCQDEIWRERDLMRRRRLGIVDGGLQISTSVVSL